MGCGEIEPAGGPYFRIRAVEGDKKIGAQGKAFPSQEEVQSVDQDEHQPHADEHGVPPKPACSRGAGVRMLVPICPAVERACPANSGKQQQEKGAQFIKAYKDMFTADGPAAAPFPEGGPGKKQCCGQEGACYPCQGGSNPPAGSAMTCAHADEHSDQCAR